MAKGDKGKGLPNKKPDAAERMAIHMTRAEYEKERKEAKDKTKYKDKEK